MERPFSRFIAFAFVLHATMTASRVLAQEQAGRIAGTAAVAPFVDDATVAVVKVDVAAIKPERVQAWVADAMRPAGRADRPDRPDRMKDLQEKVVAAKRWQTDFAAAGGRTVYFIGRIAGIPFGAQINFAVVPLEQGADAKKLTELMTNLLDSPRPAPPAPDAPDKNPPAGFKGRTFGKALVVADADTIDALNQLITPAPRPDFDRALAAAGGGAVQVAVVPNSAIWANLSIAMPKAFDFAVVSGIQWIAIGIDPPPAAGVRLTVQARDAESAGKVRDLIATGFRTLRARPGFPEDPATERALTSLLPQVAGDQLKLTLDPPKVMEVARGLAPVVGGEGEQKK